MSPSSSYSLSSKITAILMKQNTTVWSIIVTNMNGILRGWTLLYLASFVQHCEFHPYCFVVVDNLPSLLWVHYTHSIVWLYHNFCFHSIRHLGSFQFGAISNEIFMNIVWNDHVRCLLRSGITGPKEIIGSALIDTDNFPEWLYQFTFTNLSMWEFRLLRTFGNN